jgi:hypothetical protein
MVRLSHMMAIIDFVRRRAKYGSTIYMMQKCFALILIIHKKKVFEHSENTDELFAHLLDTSVIQDHVHNGTHHYHTLRQLQLRIAC